MAFRSFIVLLTLLTFSQHIFALNILAIISLPFRSHYLAFQNLFRELANRGHSVTVMNNFPDVNPVQNLHFVDLSHNRDSNGTPTLEYYEGVPSSVLHLYNIYRHFLRSPLYVKTDCENLFTHDNAKVHFAKGVKYDVIFVEQFMSDCGLAYAGALYDAPIIGITSHVMLPWSYPRLGLPFDFSADSFYLSNSGPNPSLYNKVENALVAFLFNTISRYNIHRNIYNVFNKHLPNNTLDIEKVARQRMKMMFSYQHFSLTGARVLAPQLLEIAGIHIGNPKPLPDVLERFLADANHGAIYVSFGSNLKATTMTRKMIKHFIDAFKRIPQKVIFKWENTTAFPEPNENIFTGHWLPQLDILCHPKVITFVSHGGMLSMSEAAHCGKPMLAMPFFGDQFSNCAMIRATGLGKTMFFKHVNSDNLVEAINELTTHEMQLNARRISKLWHDRPLKPIDSAIYWTEYVARNGGAPPSLPSKHNTWFESMLLDVYSVCIAMFLVVISIVYIFCKLLKLMLVMLFGRFFSKRKFKSE